MSSNLNEAMQELQRALQSIREMRTFGPGNNLTDVLEALRGGAEITRAMLPVVRFSERIDAILYPTGPNVRGDIIQLECWGTDHFPADRTWYRLPKIRLTFHVILGHVEFEFEKGGERRVVPAGESIIIPPNTWLRGKYTDAFIICRADPHVAAREDMEMKPMPKRPRKPR